MAISPVTGQRVLVIKQEKAEEITARNAGKDNERIQLSGEVGYCYNYVTLECYGHRDLIPFRK